MRIRFLHIIIISIPLLFNACKQEDTTEAKAHEERKHSDETEATFVDTLAREVTFLHEKKHCFNLKCIENDTVLAMRFGLYERKGDSVFVDCPDWGSNQYRRIKSKYFKVEYGPSLQFDGIKDYREVMAHNQSFVIEPTDIANEFFHLHLDNRTIWVYTGYVKDTMIIEGNKIRKL